jgi:hypothetical protein
MQVLLAGNSVAVVDALNADAPIGSAVAFQGGARGCVPCAARCHHALKLLLRCHMQFACSEDGVLNYHTPSFPACIAQAGLYTTIPYRMLLWRHPTGECYVAITSDADTVQPRQSAWCHILGVKARFEEETIVEYEMLRVPVGSDLRGCVVDFMCAVQQRVTPGTNGSHGAEDLVASTSAAAAQLPLMNEQVAMEDREVISEPLVTGIRVRSQSGSGVPVEVPKR